TRWAWGLESTSDLAEIGGTGPTFTNNGCVDGASDPQQLAGGSSTENVTAEMTSGFFFAGEVSNTGTTESATAELAFGAAVGAGVIDVFIPVAAEFATSAFSWAANVSSSITTLLTGALTWGASVSADRPTLLQR